MTAPSPVERELRAAEAAWTTGNEGKARVCARRAVALAAAAWLARRADPPWHGDAMEHLRQIHGRAAFPTSVRQAAERLSTAVTKREAAAFTVDPIRDATIIIAHLTGDTGSIRASLNGGE